MKVIVVGMPKTGTSSVHRALEILGLRSVHYRHTVGELKGQIAIQEDLEFIDALSDINASAFFEAIDRRYEGCKFIYTVRELNGWLSSICKSEYWVGFLRKLKAEPYSENPTKVGDGSRDDYRTECFNALFPNIPKHFERNYFIDRYVQHDRRVFDYFKNRKSDLLVLDVCGGSGFNKLCKFFGKPLARRPFPKEEQSLYPWRVDSSKYQIPEGLLE